MKFSDEELAKIQERIDNLERGITNIETIKQGICYKQDELTGQMVYEAKLFKK